MPKHNIQRFWSICSLLPRSWRQQRVGEDLGGPDLKKNVICSSIKEFPYMIGSAIYRICLYVFRVSSDLPC